MDSRSAPSANDIQEEMRKLGFEETWFDSMGDTVGRIGSGRRVLVYDSHIDTVGIGNPDEWNWDPFIGKIDKGRLYARGACDEKGSTPMIYGLALAHKLGLLEGWTALLLWQHGRVVRRDCPARFRRTRGYPPGLRRDRRADQDAGLPRPQGARRDRSYHAGAVPMPPPTS